jgi:hypothetical protein
MLVDNNEIIVSGKFVKIVQFREEWDIDVDDPELVISKIKASGIKADVFTFQQRLPESKPKFRYAMEWDSVAAIPIKSYEYWLKKQVTQNSRKKIGLATRKRVEVKVFEFNDETLKDIIGIYHDTPIRQGIPDFHYNMDFETAKEDNATFLDRATFIGAFYKDELIGYIKIVSTDGYARTMGIIGKISHRDKAPMNLLVAKAVEICAERKIPYLTYGKYDFGKLGSNSLKAFKRNLGFENIIHPRYFIPLTTWGKLMLKLKLHNRFVQLLPLKLVRFLLFLRNKWNEKKYSKYIDKSNR